MSGPDEDADLLAALGDAVRGAAEVPASFLAVARSAYDWRTVDAELAELAHDATVLAGSRSEAALRAMTFVAAALTVELEVTGEALLGQLVPPQPGTVELRTRTGVVRAVTADELGWFTVRPLPDALFRLHVTTAAGDSVVTAWATL